MFVSMSGCVFKEFNESITQWIDHFQVAKLIKFIFGLVAYKSEALK